MFNHTHLLWKHDIRKHNSFCESITCKRNSRTDHRCNEQGNCEVAIRPLLQVVMKSHENGYHSFLAMAAFAQYTTSSRCVSASDCSRPRGVNSTMRCAKYFAFSLSTSYFFTCSGVGG